MLSPIEQAMIRAWIKGIPVDYYADEHPSQESASALLQGLLQKITHKARRLNTPWKEFFTKPRQDGNTWEKVAINYLQWIVDARDIEPSLDHPVEFWINDTLSPILIEAGLKSMRAYLTWRSTQGNDWWRYMSGIGQQSAKKLDQSLQSIFPDFKPSLPCPQLPIVVYQADAIVPIEYLLVPNECDGSHGKFRGKDECFINAQNDLQAVNCWLDRLDPKSHTFRAYKREAERLLLWTVVQQSKALSSLDVNDIVDYRRFLQNPQPAARWIGLNKPQTSPDWKPFIGPLSPRSINHSEIVLGNLFKFLLSQGYLRFNPYSGLAKQRDRTGIPKINVNRSLSKTQWEFTRQFIEEKVTSSDGFTKKRWIRIRLMINLLYASGLRLHELAKSTIGDIFTIERDNKRQIWLKVIGKGKKERDIPLSPRIFQLINETIVHISGISRSEIRNNFPIITPLRQPMTDCLTPKAIYVELKWVFKQIADSLEDTDPDSANHLANASTHWLRHTHGSVAIDNNIPLTMIRDNLGHASIATTSQYLHSDTDSRHNLFTKIMHSTE